MNRLLRFPGNAVVPGGLSCVVLVLAAALSVAAPLTFVPQTIVQPDGSVIECFASGDEYYNWLHDADGFTIVQDQGSGYYVYALLQKDNLVPSTHIVGRVKPAAVGLTPWLTIPPERITDLRSSVDQISGVTAVASPKEGSIRNLVVFIRFADDPPFAYPTTRYQSMFNEPAAGSNSMFNYFKEVSYQKLFVTSYFYPQTTTTAVLSYQDSNVRAYYKPYSSTNTIGYPDSARTTREHTLLKNAINAISSQVPDTLKLDADNDSNVDNVVFVVSGRPTAWSTLLWPHKWSLYSQTVKIGTKRVYTYNLQLDSVMNNGVLCHEMFHTIGAPDLYHYTGNGISPVGSWDIMESNQNPPQHMGSWMKYKYGKWIASIPTITAPGAYTLKALVSPTGNAYKIPSPYSSTEFFIVEYRRKLTTFEGKIPGEGLLVYRINSSYTGNASGPPDEVYAYRVDGTRTVNGTVSKAALSENAGRISLSDSTNPATFLTAGGPGGLHITSVGRMGDSIAFTLGHPISVRFGRVAAEVSGPDSVSLTWSTLLEQRNKSFEIERSLQESTGYVTVSPSPIPGRSPSTTEQTYSFTDPSSGGSLYYRVKQTDSANVVSYSKPVQVTYPTAVADEPAPVAFGLSQNYPNPFNPVTTIEFAVSRSADARVEVFDLLGRQVGILFDGFAEAGVRQTVTFDASALASGVYVYTLVSGGERDIRRLMLLK